MQIKIGQDCTCYPATFNTSCFGHAQITRGKIRYIHPNLRYVIVGVKTPGGELRESFFLRDITLLENKRKRKR